jgi:hypothetical protein
MTALTTTMSPEGHAIMERVIATGDLAQLTPAERNRFYFETCSSLGLNPLTKPFEYIRLNGKLVLYAKRDCADQLRKIHGISLRILEQRAEGGLFLVTVEAQDKSGRVDSDVGAVAVNNLQGEARANAILKAITKAKRRVTLSICGLGMLDETEVSDIPAGERQAWEEPKAETASPAAQPDGDMQHVVQIRGADGTAHYTGSIAREALVAYGNAKRHSTDPAAVAKANLGALRLILPCVRNGTAEKIRREIEATEALMQDEPEVVEDVGHDGDGVVLDEFPTVPEPAKAEQEAA